MAKARVIWNQDMQFVGITESGHAVVVDATPDHGGYGSAPSNTEMIAVAQGGCTGMDIVSILQKKRVAFDRFEMEVDLQPTKEHPRYIQRVEITYKIWGEDLSKDAIHRAVELSLEKYCIVAHTLRGRAELSYKILINPSE
ncbi:OsmC family protein [Candidatus Acetothermia bacterium]|nr:OsmC family protein [Candidatus Acetothermia bacterium]MBI3643253.1 OsmC family protein [Candidatus Acetothermia bacterium]